MSDPDELAPQDKAALEESLRVLLATEPARAGQLEHIEARDGWFNVCRFASGLLQEARLNLYPHQRTPSDFGDDNEEAVAVDEDDHMAMVLLRKMLALNISRYHHDPLGALAEVEKKGKRR